MRLAFRCVLCMNQLLFRRVLQLMELSELFSRGSGWWCRETRGRSRTQAPSLAHPLRHAQPLCPSSYSPAKWGEWSTVRLREGPRVLRTLYPEVWPLLWALGVTLVVSKEMNQQQALGWVMTGYVRGCVDAFKRGLGRRHTYLSVWESQSCSFWCERGR